MHTVFWKAYCKCTLTQKQLLSTSKMLLICVGICIYTIDVCFNGGKFYSINVPKCRKVNFCFSKSFLVGGYASIIYQYSFVHQNNSLVLQCTEISLFMKIKPNQWIYSIYIKTQPEKQGICQFSFTKKKTNPAFLKICFPSNIIISTETSTGQCLSFQCLQPNLSSSSVV